MQIFILQNLVLSITGMSSRHIRVLDIFSSHYEKKTSPKIFFLTYYFISDKYKKLNKLFTEEQTT